MKKKRAVNFAQEASSGKVGFIRNQSGPAGSFFGKRARGKAERDGSTC
jgi:hypothetical protein